MDNLDEKLLQIFKRELLFYHHNDKWFIGIQGDTLVDANAMVKQIKQAFIDDGWLRTIDMSTPAITNYNKPKKP